MRKKILSAEDKCARNPIGGIRAICPVNRIFPFLFSRFSMNIISWNVRGLNGLTKKRMMKTKIILLGNMLIILEVKD